MQSGTAVCWGANGSGQLGDGTTTERHAPVDVPGLTNGVAANAAGAAHTCALTTSERVQCWGRNSDGQLGNGTTTDFATPNPQPLDVCATALCDSVLSDIVALAAGDYHTCALTANGGVKCWGRNGNGQLGNGANADSSTPVDVVGLESAVTAVTAGAFHTCALTTGGGVKCWGSNSEGHLGDGTTVDRWTPVDVVGLGSGVAAIAAGGIHTCALTVEGAVQCWGFNFDGEVGDGTDGNVRMTPVDVLGLGSGVTAIDANGLFTGHTCALKTDGGLACWGTNGSGQLGDGTATDRHSPVDVTGLSSRVLAVAAGSGHTCAATAADGIECWGDNRSGQLGDGTTTSRTAPVVVVSPEKTPPGDTDCDGSVTSIDAALVLQRSAALISTLACPDYADVNGDRHIDAVDALLILQYVAGLLHSLPP
jgi:alpha-tubulin suppressor-like RCC1 family protein